MIKKLIKTDLEEDHFMKKKRFTRPVSITLPEEMFNDIKAITDERDIGISDYVREAIEDKIVKNIEDGGKER